MSKPRKKPHEQTMWAIKGTSDVTAMIRVFDSLKGYKA